MSSKRNPDLHPAAARVAALAETAEQRRRRAAPAKVIQLPGWPEPDPALSAAVCPVAALQGPALGGGLGWPLAALLGQIWAILGTRGRWSRAREGI